MTPREKPQKLLPYVQGLRALAALSVAFTHIAHDAISGGADPHHRIAAVDAFLPWGAGVDIFFVISGFVIVHASAPLFATGGKAARIFMRHRLTRIVPLYWIMTSAFLAMLLLDPATIHGDIGGPAYLAASYLFLPWPRPNGLMEPAFGLGWTLNYEMFFYAVFTPFLLLRRGLAVPAAALLLAGFVLTGRFWHFGNPQLAYWSGPIILEFCAGMLLAQGFAAGIRLPLALRIGFCLAAIYLLHCFAGDDGQREFAWGIPAVLLVAAATLAPVPARLGRAQKLLVRLGDASYAMYLVHPFVMRALTILWHKFHAHPPLAGPIYVLAGLAVAQSAALILNAQLERRLSNLLRRGAKPKDEAVQMPGMRTDRILREP